MYVFPNTSIRLRRSSKGVENILLINKLIKTHVWDFRKLQSSRGLAVGQFRVQIAMPPLSNWLKMDPVSSVWYTIDCESDFRRLK